MYDRLLGNKLCTFGPALGVFQFNIRHFSIATPVNHADRVVKRVENYTLQEATSILDVNDKTLRKWLDLAKMRPTTDPYDARRKLLSAEQIQYLAQRFLRDPNVLNPDANNMAARLAKLEREIEELRGELRRKQGVA